MTSDDGLKEHYDPQENGEFFELAKSRINSKLLF